MHEPQHSKSMPVPSLADSAQPESTQPPGDAAMVADLPHPTAGLRYGRFALQRFHAKGGLGEVHVALDEELHREVALKRMQGRCASDPLARRRFLNEAEITARLEHPGIVPVYGLVQDEHGQPCYAMRFIAGESLAEAIKNWHAGGAPAYDGLPFRQLLQRFISVCQTMAYAHSKHVLHRDLKPANIMLGPFGETLVVDWGLAPDLAFSRDAQSSDPSAGEDIQASTVDFAPSPGDERVYTQTGQALGTLGYMAPEQAAGRWDAVGPGSDIYSLGATLYEMVTGERPIRGPDRLEALQKAQAGDFPAPRRLKRDVPKSLEAICLKSMALNPQDRYGNAKDLAADVEQWLADEPVAAYAEPVLVRAGRWARKHKAVMATAAAVLLTATIGLGAGLYFVDVERKRTDQAWKAEAIQTQLAQKNEQLAQENDEISRAVLGFVEDKVFKAARPKDKEGGLGYDVKLAEAVKAALPFVDKSFIKQPLIEARLRTTIGISFSYLGDAKAAAEQYQLARALHLQYRGADHPDTLKSINNLANSYLDAGRTQEALRLHEETLRLYETKLGRDHLETLGSMNDLANSYAAAGRTQQALQLREETLQLRKVKLGSDHPETLVSMQNLANSYNAVGRTQEALQLREETLQLRKVKLGPDHFDTLRSMNNLAESYVAAGRTQEALQLHEEVLQLTKAKVGSDHLQTLASMINLANSYQRFGRSTDALKLYEQALPVMKAKAPDHLFTFNCMNNLAECYAAAGRTQEALQLHEETLKLQKAKLGPEHPQTLTGMNSLAGSYIELGQAKNALTLSRQTLELRQRRLQAEPKNALEQALLAWTHGQMGQAEQLQLDFAAAAPSYAKSVEMFEKLDQAGTLKHPFFRGRLKEYQQRLVLSRKAEQAVHDLDFALKQPAAEVPQLLDMRLRYLLNEQKLPAAIESAAKIKELAGNQPNQLYDAACAYALCGAVKIPVVNAPGSDKLVEEAMALLKQAVAKGYKNAAHMKQDKDLEALRPREDFKKLVNDLENREK